MHIAYLLKQYGFKKVKMKIFLITGANGLLGRSMCNKLSQQSDYVYALTRELLLEPIPNVTYIPINFESPWSDQALPTSVDTIIHLAQSVKFRDFPEKAADIFGVNIDSTARLLNYAKNAGAKQFIYASSGGVYEGGSLALDENSPISPVGKLGFYLGSKMCSEILVQSYAALMQVIVIRPFFIYGPGQNRSMLIPRLMDNIISGNPISLMGKHGIRINPIHVEDAAASIVAALLIKESATFNIAGPKVMSIHEICNGIGHYLGKSPVFVNQSGQANDLIADITSMCVKLRAPSIFLLDSLSDIDTSLRR